MTTADLEKKQARLKKLGNIKTLSDTVSNRKKQEVEKDLKQVDVYLRLPVDEIVSNKQVRKKFTGIQELAESIDQGGLEQPIHVLPKNEDGHYVIAKGERRYRAVKLLDWTEIPAIVQENYKTKSDRIFSQLIENIQRDNLEPHETSEALVELKEEGLKNKAIAKRMGVSETFVSRHISLSKASSYIIALSEKGIVRDIDTLTFIRQLDEIAPERAKLLVEKAEEAGELSRPEARRVYKMVQDELDRKAKGEDLADSNNHENSTDQGASDYEKISELSVTPDNENTSYDDDNDSDLNSNAADDSSVDAQHKADHENDTQPTDSQDPVKALPGECIPGSGVITHIDVITSGKKQAGVLLLGVSEHSKDHVWVQLDDSEAPERVRVSQISIVSVNRAKTTVE